MTYSDVKCLLDALLWDIYGKVSIRNTEDATSIDESAVSIGGIDESSENVDSNWKYSRNLLAKQSICTLTQVCASLRLEIRIIGTYLGRALIALDKTRRKNEDLCRIVNAYLVVYSISLASGDSLKEMRFSVSPPPLSSPHAKCDDEQLTKFNPDGIDETDPSSDFNQWLHAMKMVARLPGGMPPEFRRKLWLALSNKYLKSENVNWEKEQEKCFSEQWREDDEELGIQIVKDLHRTGSSLCSGPAGTINQAKLKRILLGYARYNPEVGYCQGFNMLGALILQVMDKDEVESIKVMIFLVEGILPTGYFSGSLGGLQADMAVFREIMTLKLPKLAKHLQRLQGPVENAYEPPLTNVFTMQWFLTMFCTCLPTSCVLRVWDLVLIEGSDVLLRTALAIWSLLEERILNVRTADDFYCKMGSLSGELLNGHLIDSNGLIEKVVQLGPIPELQKLRDKHLYNISPWRDQNKGLKLYYSDEEPDSDDDSRLAVTTAWGLRLNRRGSLGLPTSSKPPPDTRDRIALDISLLKKQYDRLRERQRQAHIIITAAVARQTVIPQQSSSVPVNQLLIGRAPIVTNKGRRLGPPKGAVPPPRKLSVPNVKIKTTTTKQIITGETLYWRDTEIAKRRKGSLKWKDISVPSEDESKTMDTQSNASSSSERPQSNSPRLALHKRSDSSSYSEDSDANSSTSTSLCDEDDNDPTDIYSSSLESSPLRKHKSAKKGIDVSETSATSVTKLSVFNDFNEENNLPFTELTSSEKSMDYISDQKLETCEEEEDSTTESDRATSNLNNINELLAANKSLLGETTSNATNFPDNNTTISAYTNSITKLLTKSTSNDEMTSNDLLGVPPITSISQLSPIPDINKFLCNSSISPLKTPTSFFDYSNLIIGNNEEETNTCEFDVNEDGVTNEYFERVNIVERPTHLDLLYSLNNEKSFEDAFNISKIETKSLTKDSELPILDISSEDVKPLKENRVPLANCNSLSTDSVSKTSISLLSALELDMSQDTTLLSPSDNSITSAIALDNIAYTVATEKQQLTSKISFDLEENVIVKLSPLTTDQDSIMKIDTNLNLPTESDNKNDTTSYTSKQYSTNNLKISDKFVSPCFDLVSNESQILEPTLSGRAIPTEMDLETRFKAFVVEKSSVSVKSAKKSATPSFHESQTTFEASPTDLKVTTPSKSFTKLTVEESQKNPIQFDANSLREISFTPNKNLDPFHELISFPSTDENIKIYHSPEMDYGCESPSKTYSFDHEKMSAPSFAYAGGSTKQKLSEEYNKETNEHMLSTDKKCMISNFVDNDVLEKGNKCDFSGIEVSSNEFSVANPYTTNSVCNKAEIETSTECWANPVKETLIATATGDNCVTRGISIGVSDSHSTTEGMSHLNLTQKESEFQRSPVSPKRIIPSTADLEERFNAVQSRSPKKTRPLSTTDIEIQALLRDRTRNLLNSPNQSIKEEVLRSSSVTIDVPSLRVISPSSASVISKSKDGLLDLRNESHAIKSFEYSEVAKPSRPIPSESDLEFRFQAAELHIDKTTRKAKNPSPDKILIDTNLAKKQPPSTLTNFEGTEDLALKSTSVLTNSFLKTIESTTAETTCSSDNIKSSICSLDMDTKNRLCIMKEKSYSLEDYKLEEKIEIRPTSCPEARESLNESSRSHSDRILKIIEENSQILHRILKNNTTDENASTLDKPGSASYFSTNDKSEIQIENPLSEIRYNISSSLSGSYREPSETEENKDEIELSEKSRPPSRVSDTTSVSYKSDDNIADRLASIKNTIKSIDSLCEEKGYRKDKCQRYIDSLFEPSNKDKGELRSTQLPPSIHIIEDNANSGTEFTKLPARTYRDIKREISPRRRRDEDREEYESRVRRDKDDSEVATITSDCMQTERPISPYYANRYPSVYESDHLRSSTPTLYVPAKLQIRHTTVTSTFYDRYLSQKEIEKNFKSPRSPRSPRSPVSPNVSKNYLDVSNTSANTDRNSKSAENSPSRLKSTVESNTQSATQNYNFNNIIAESSYHIRSCDNILLQLKSSSKDKTTAVGVSSSLYNPLPAKIKKPSEIGIQLGLYKKPSDSQLPKS